MNWIKRIRNKVSNNSSLKKEIPDNLWIKCDSCTSLLFREDLTKNNYVCTSCQHHFYFPAEKRFDLLFDDCEYKVLTIPKTVKDPLGFKDKEKYSDKLKKHQNAAKTKDALISAVGKIDQNLVVVSVMNFKFMGGSMGVNVGESFVQAVDQAIQMECPFIIVTASGGARMQEGLYSLMQMAKTTIAIEKLKEAGLPYIVVLTNPTTGGVTASFAMLGDIHVAEPGATIGFAGARVIEQTIKESLPEGFQTAEYLEKNGMVDIVVHRAELKNVLSRLIDMIMNKHK